MLVQASRDGNLEVVLRLLYTNPFIHRQELRDALWEAVRCERVDVLRSLLEFRVDPQSTPSPLLSKAPIPLGKVPWTPILAMAVNESPSRAEIVAELLSLKRVELDEEHNVQAQESLSASGAASKSTPEGDQGTPKVDCPISESGCGMPMSKETERVDVGSCCPSKKSANTKNQLAAVVSHDPLENKLGELDHEELAALESELDEVVKLVRFHRQKRWEEQLQSVQRRHAETRRDQEQLKEGHACVVCSESEKTTLFMPCRHLCTCEACAAQLSLCPICRGRIEEKVQCIRP
mmetsp:Transcript_31957/g.62862  ORF Transcript_31957/g.62862 Transcript_31957/m.62862 type:complete len:292 (-) Transcript_31957:23-898(-)